MSCDVLLVCAGPLPSAETTLTCSYNLRAAKLIRWLRANSLDPRIIAVDLFHNPRSWYGKTHSSMVGEYTLVGYDEEGVLAIQRFCEQEQPRCLFAISAGAAATACRANPPLPIWADMPGWILPEAQLKASIDRDDIVIDQSREMEIDVLARADKISVVSHNQLHATMGELALLKRLNPENFNYRLLHRLPSLAMNWQPLLPTATPTEYPGLTEPLPDNARILLWSGTYNVWTDIDFLFQLTEELLKRLPDLHFVSTGGRIPGFNESIYDRFAEWAAVSAHRERYRILPWQSFQNAIAWFESAHLGLCIDGENLEIHYGSRTRIVDMLAHRLPVATTVTTELTRDLANANGIVSLDPQRRDQWAGEIASALANRERLAQLAQQGHSFAMEEYGLEKSSHELLAWLREPSHAPDYRIDKPAPSLAAIYTHESNGTQREDKAQRMLVTWSGQAEIESASRRLLDPYPPGRMSRVLQSALKQSFRWKPTRLLALSAWQKAPRYSPRSVNLPRWQSRLESWIDDRPLSARESRLLASSAREIYRSALNNCTAPIEKKAINVLMAHHEYDRTDELISLPQNIQVEPASFCNIRCRMCPIAHFDYPKLLMTRETFDRLIPALPWVFTLQFIGRGEPTLNQDLPYFLEMGARHRCWTTLFSNAVALKPDLARQLIRFGLGDMIVTFPGGDAESYAWATQSNRLERVLDNLRMLHNLKKRLQSTTPNVVLNFPLMASSFRSAPDAVRQAADVGADAIMLTIAYIMRPEMRSESLLTVDHAEVDAIFGQCRKIADAHRLRIIFPGLDADTTGGASGPSNRYGCLIPWQSLLVRANGEVEVDEYNRKIVGDLHSQSLREIWNGEEMQRFRKGMVRHDGIDYCDSCFYRSLKRNKMNDRTHIIRHYCSHSYR